MEWPSDSKWAKKFHIWRMDWDEESIRIYLDDEYYIDYVRVYQKNNVHTTD